jgi:hypothetical protein
MQGSLINTVLSPIQLLHKKLSLIIPFLIPPVLSFSLVTNRKSAEGMGVPIADDGKAQTKIGGGKI